MRQNGSGVASIQILIDGEVFKVLNNPYPTLTSWQWVSATLQQMSVSNLTIVMMVRGSSESGVVYFDDLCVTISPNEGVFLYVIICHSSCYGLIQFAGRLVSNQLMH